MDKKDSYYRGGSCKFKLSVHIVLVTKYRKSLLIGTLDDDMKNIIQDIAKENDWNIQIMETDKNHIHILLDYKPYENVSDIVKKLKQYSTFRIWLKYPELSKEYWKRKIFWSGGYFACSIGDASNETIKKYIEEQG